jgi:hypothetical protein
MSGMGDDNTFGAAGGAGGAPDSSRSGGSVGGGPPLDLSLVGAELLGPSLDFPQLEGKIFVSCDAVSSKPVCTCSHGRMVVKRGCMYTKSRLF